MGAFCCNAAIYMGNKGSGIYCVQNLYIIMYKRKFVHNMYTVMYTSSQTEL